MEWKIEDIMDKGITLVKSFNYEKVHEYMKLNKRTYWYTGSQPPTVEELHLTALSVMHQAVANVGKTNSATHCGTGGFNVYIFPEWCGVKLTFEPIEFKKSSY